MPTDHCPWCGFTHEDGRELLRHVVLGHMRHLDLETADTDGFWKCFQCDCEPFCLFDATDAGLEEFAAHVEERGGLVMHMLECGLDLGDPDNG